MNSTEFAYTEIVVEYGEVSFTTDEKDPTVPAALAAGWSIASRTLITWENAQRICTSLPVEGSGK